MPPSRPFFEHWRARASFIEGLDPVENFYEANVLAWTSLDALANLWARCLRKELRRGRDRRRMGEFLARHGGEAFERVSLPALWAFSEDDRLTGSTEVIRLLQTFGGRRAPTIWERQQARMPSEDPLASDVLVQLADIKGCLAQKGTTVEDLVLNARFGEIAYTEMRCGMVHEGRLGDHAHGFDLGAESHEGPTYLSGVFGVPPSIGFSPRYMVSVIHSCVDGFEEEARAANVDPAPSPRASIVIHPDDEA